MKCGGLYLQQEVHEVAVGFHFIFELVQDDERLEREASTLWEGGKRSHI